MLRILLFLSLLSISFSLCFSANIIELSPNGIVANYSNAPAAVELSRPDSAVWAKVLFVGVQEIDINGTVVAEARGFDALDRQWRVQSNQTLNESTVDVGFEAPDLAVSPIPSNLSSPSNGTAAPFNADFRLDTFFALKENSTTSANEEIIMQPGELKWQLAVRSWQFQSEENKLRFVVQLLSSEEMSPTMSPTGPQRADVNTTSPPTTSAPVSSTTTALSSTTTPSPTNSTSSTTPSPSNSSTTTSAPTNSTSSTTPTPTNSTSSTTPTPTNSTSSTTPMPTNSTSSTTPMPTNSTSSTTPMPTNSTSSTTPMPTNSTGSTTPMPTNSTGSTTPMPTNSTGSTTPMPTNSTGSTTPMPTNSTGSTTPMPTNSSSTTTPAPSNSTNTTIGPTTIPPITLPPFTTPTPTSPPPLNPGYVIVPHVPGTRSSMAIIFGNDTANLIIPTVAVEDGRDVQNVSVNIMRMEGILTVQWDFPFFNDSLFYDPVLTITNLLSFNETNSTIPTTPPGSNSTTTPSPSGSNSTTTAAPSFNSSTTTSAGPHRNTTSPPASGAEQRAAGWVSVVMATVMVMWLMNEQKQYVGE